MAQSVKNPPEMHETQIQSLCWEDPLKKGTATHSQYPCLENPMDRGAWWATVHGVTKSQTQLSDLHIMNIRTTLVPESPEAVIHKPFCSDPQARCIRKGDLKCLQNDHS